MYVDLNLDDHFNVLQFEPNGILCDFYQFITMFSVSFTGFIIIGLPESYYPMCDKMYSIVPF